MDLASLRTLAIANVGEDELRQMVDQGEHLLVEFKREPPKPPGLGAEAASFANTIGGWILLGIDDSGTPVGWTPPGKGTDLQAHVGDLLRNQVDPVPPFIAASRELDGKPIAVIRVFESADTPVLVRGTGALYVRDAGGKQPVDDRRTLIELARRARGPSARPRRVWPGSRSRRAS